MKYNIHDRVIRDIVSSAERYGVEKVILFGSRARGDHRSNSDIDIAVSGGNYDDFYWSLNENAWTLLSFDVVDLDRGISDELREEIKRDGVVIYENKEAR